MEKSARAPVTITLHAIITIIAVIITIIIIIIVIIIIIITIIIIAVIVTYTHNLEENNCNMTEEKRARQQVKRQDAKV